MYHLIVDHVDMFPYFEVMTYSKITCSAMSAFLESGVGDDRLGLSLGSWCSKTGDETKIQFKIIPQIWKFL